MAWMIFLVALFALGLWESYDRQKQERDEIRKIRKD
jgi:hypothetical protein